MRQGLILLDIDSQRDFFLPRGSCYSPKADCAAAEVRRLFRWAQAGNIPVLSTVLRLRRQDRGVLAPVPHCVEGTEGEKKLPGTALPSRINLGLRNCTDLPRDIFRDHQQVIVERRNTDIFTHARLERLITELPMTTFIICGAGLARGIFQAAIGLRSRGFGVIVAGDAVLDLGDKFTEMARTRMEAKGVIFAKTSEIVAPKPVRHPVPFRTAAREPLEHARSPLKK
jgi:nicotinamidase-related amidase